MCFNVTLEICRELMNSLVSIATPEAEPGTMSWPSLCQVMRMGMSPDDTTQAMYMSFPTEVEGISKGWMRGGTGGERKSAEGQWNKGGHSHGRVAVWPSGAMLKEREGHWPVGPSYPLPHPFSPHPLQPIIAALVRVQLAGGSHSVAIVMEVGVGVLQLRHLGDLI